jgi:hypothetical protein
MSERIQVENNYYKNSNAILNDVILKNNECLFIIWDNNIVSTHFLILDEERIDFNDGHCTFEVNKFNPFIEIEHNGTKLKISAVGLKAERKSDD